jgi:hypothetical protein
MLGVVVSALRETMQRTGVWEHCDCTGFSVSPTAMPDGEFAVSSTAALERQAIELLELADTLRADGYRVRLCQAGRAPLLMVRGEPEKR